MDEYSGLVAINSKHVSDHALKSAGFGYVRRFAVLPSLHDPRWFIPLDSPKLAAKALQIFQPVRRTTQLFHLATKHVARSGLPIWYRDQVIVAQRQISPLEKALQASVCDIPFSIAISTGTEGKNRKSTIAMIKPDGEISGFAKVSCSTVSRQLVRQEADCLSALSLHPRLTPFIPELLFSAEVDDSYVNVQKPLPGTLPPACLTMAHYQLLSLLQDSSSKPANATKLVSNLKPRAAAIHGQELVPLQPLDRAMAILNDVQVPGTVSHGDFAPWNLRRHGGYISAFDWEYAELDSIPMLDTIHHELQAGMLLKGWDIDRAFDALLSLQYGHPAIAAGVNPSEMQAIQIIYLTNLLLQSCERDATSNPIFKLRAQLLRRLNSSMEEDAG